MRPPRLSARFGDEVAAVIGGALADLVAARSPVVDPAVLAGEGVEGLSGRRSTNTSCCNVSVSFCRYTSQRASAASLGSCERRTR
jgi:hypothetical protein